MLTLSADQSEVKAGGTILLTAVLAHSRPEQGEYTLSIRGVDTAWVTFYPPTLSVAAGGQATATILVAPPVNAAAADLALTVRAVSTAPNAEAEATFSVRLTSTTGAATGRARRKGRLTWPRLLLLSAGVVVVVAAVGIFFLLHRHSPPPPQQTAACASQPTQLVDLYSDDTTTAIRISDPDLADVRILRTEPSDTLSPLFSSLLSLSPDGSHLAYVTAGNEALDDAHLWSLDVANPAQRQELAVIPHGLWQVRPAWSPDNHQVAFLRLNEQQAAASQTQLELWVAQVGGQPHKVAAPPELRPDGFYGNTTQPLCWAQDNQSVIFSSVTRDASPTDQGARATGSAQPTDNLNPGTPQQIAVNVQTGATEQLATPTAAAADSAPTIPAAPAGGAGCGLPVFSQNDPAWRNIIMQSSGDTIGKFGCAVTATAMLLNYYGTTLTPAQLNTCLGTNADLIQWTSVVPCANGAITASNAFDFAWPSLDQVLASGNPAIVGMVRGQTGLHFVVVTAGGGGEATDYAVIDPWDGTTSKTLQTFLDAGYNLRWIRTYTGTDKACPRLVAPQTPAGDASGIAPVPDGPLLVPSQLLPLFAKVADQTGIPRELLLSIARIESGFTPRSVGPLIEKFSGTEDAHALGMMQFLPSTYRTYSAQVDAARAKAASGGFHTLSVQADNPAATPLGDAGIWDPESSIWAAAFFLQQHGYAKDQRGAIFAYNNSNAYVDLVLKTAAQFKGGTIPDANQYDPNATSKPGTLAAPNPINPPPLSAAAAAAARPPAPKQANGAAAQANGGNPGAASGGGANGGANGGAGNAAGGTGSSSGGNAADAGGVTVPIRWSVPEGSISRTAVILNFNVNENVGRVTKLSLLTLTVPGSTASPVNESTPSRPFTPGMVITDDGVYEAVAVTSQNGQTRISRRKFTIDRTAPTLDLSVVTTGTSTATPAAGASQAVTTADALHPVADGAIRLKIGYADTLSGVASVEYRIDGGDWQLYFNAVAFKGDALIDIPGDHTIRVRATDVAGNVSQERALDFTVKADPNKPFLDSGQPVLKPVSSIGLSTVATTVAQVPSPTPITANTAAETAAVSATVAVTPTAPPTVVSTPVGTQQGGAATLLTPTVIPTIRATPVGAAAAANVAPTVTTGVTATVATTPTVTTPAITPTVAITATAVTSTPKTSPTPQQANSLTATPATTATTTATVAVSATPGPTVKFTPPSCSDAAVRSIASCTSVTVTNAGTTDLRINNINTTGEFLIGDAGSTCTTALAPNASCNIPILFIPTAIGKRTGTLTITDSAPDSPHSLPLTGNGIGAPAVAFAPPQFTCPETELGQSSQCSITLTNTGSAALTIASGIVVTGDFSPDPKGQDCGLTLAVSAHCTLAVIFAPTVHGIRTGVMTVTDNAPGSPHPISLTGKGLAPGVILKTGVVISPASVVCTPTDVGTSSPCLASSPLTLTNIGDAPLHISSIIPHDPFLTIGVPPTDVPPCPPDQPNSTICQLPIPITFTPTERGIHTSGLTITDNALTSPQTVQISVQGLAPVVTLSAPSVTCPKTIVGHVTTACTPATLTITNSGDAILNIASITPSSDFTVGTPDGGTNCGPTLDWTTGHNSCTLPITFAPTVRGIHEGSLIIADDAAGSPHIVQLTATALAPLVDLSATSLICANNDPDPTAVGVDVGRSSDCGSSLTPTLIPLTLTNKGDADLHVSIVPNDPFITVAVATIPSGVNANCGLLSSNLNGPILPNQVCTLKITFTPTDGGAHVSGITFTDDAIGSPQSVQIPVLGLAPAVKFNTSPSSVPALTCPSNSTDPNFVGVIVGTSNPCYASLPATSLTLTNNGNAPLNISSIVAGDDFKVDRSQCPTTLAVGANCTLPVTFAPTARGNHTGNLTIADNAPGSPHTLQLAATGLAPVVSLGTLPVICQATNQSPPGVIVGASSQCGSALIPTVTPLTLTNTGDMTLHISSIVPNDPFVTVGVSPTGIPPTDVPSCPAGQPKTPICQLQIPISITPTARGIQTSGVTITDDASGSPQSIQVSVTGLAPVVSLGNLPVICQDTNLGTPGVIVGKSSQCGTALSPSVTPLMLTNTGDVDLHIGSITPSSDFTVDATQSSNTCGTILSAHVSCALPIKFAPTVRGIHQGVLTIADDAAGSPHIVQLTAKALAPLAQLAPTTLTCPDTIVGGPASVCQSPTLTNLGDVPLHISSIVPSDPFLTATVPQTIVPPCPANPLPSDPCNLPITIKFAPTERGQHTSGLTITDDAIGGTQSVQIIAKGLAPVATLSGTSLTCPNTVVGQPAATCLVPGATPAPLTLTNGGDAPLNITSIVAGDDFKVDPAGCPQSLAPAGPAGVPPAGSCTLPVTFAPTTRGNHVGNLAIADNAPGTPQTVQLAATGLAPIAVLSAPTFACQDTIVGQTGTCGTTPLTLTNGGDAVLNISSIVASDDFKIAPAFCPTTLAPTVNCTLTVTFVPTTRGNHVGNLTIADNAPGSPHTVQLSAKGFAPVATLSAQTMTCPNTAVGATATCLGTPGNLPFTLRNDGDADLKISSIVASDDFKISAPLTGTFCGSTLAVGATCGMQITFAPTARGTHISSLVIADNAPGGPHSVQLTATALAPVVSLSAPTLTCPPTIVGGTPGTCGSGTLPSLQPFVLTNTGDATLHISGIVPNDPFLKVDVTQADVPPCPTGQPISAICQQTITITFTPTERGSHTSGLTITDNASGSPRSVPISVQGLAPVAKLNTASPLTCADTNAGTPGVVVGQISSCGVSVTPTVTPLTLTNDGDAPLNISSIVVGDDFKIAPGQCPPTLPVRTSPTDTANTCTLQVTFAPKAGGNHVSNLVIADNAPGSPQSVQLTGLGLAPVMNLSGLPVTCPPTTVDQTNNCTFTFTNTGTTALTIRSIVLNGDFTAASSCTSPIQPQPGPAPCQVTVTFGPIAAGIRSGSLTITDDAPDSPQVIALSGTGQAPVLSYGTPPTSNPPTVTCPDTAVGATTAATCGTGTVPNLQPLTLTNSGTAPLRISNIVASDDFKIQAGQCLGNLAAQSSCPLTVTFAPTSWGSHVGSLTITDNAEGSPHSVQLTATGLGPAVSLSPSPLPCGGSPVGTLATCPLVTLVNGGNADLTISSIVMGGDFTIPQPPTGTCGTTLAANQTHNSSCTLQVTFKPTAAGNRAGSLAIADNAPGSPQTIALSGTGQVPVLSPLQALTCVNTDVGATPTQCGTGLVLTNAGDAPLIVSSIVASDDFKVTAGQCVTTIAAAPGPNNSCTLTVAFAPTTPGNHTGTITIVDNAAGSPQTAQVTGTGLAPAVSFDLPSITCPDTAISKSNPCPVITLTNTGTAPLKHTSITANSPFVEAADTCGTADLPAGSSCTITVNFAPSASGNFTGFLTVADNAAGSPHKVPLSGNGIGVPNATMTVAGTFADTPVGQTALTGVTVTIANASNATGNLVLSLITISSEFGINNGSSTCGTTVTPGTNCVLAITFTPAADGQRSGSVTITSNAPNSLQTTLPLTGKGLGTPGITIAPTTPLICPDTLVGTTASCPTHVTITNSGTAQLTLSQIALTGDYALDALTSSTCGTAVTPGASCTLAISFKPTATGARPGTLTITDNATNPPPPHTVTLTGNGTQPGLTVTPSSITCPATVVATPATCSTTLANPGTAPLTLNPSITGGGSDYHLHTGGTNACTASLAANSATCIMYVDFTPTATGPRTGTLSLGDNAPGNPHTVALSGTGTQPTATLSTNAITCADTVTNGTGTCQQVTITNSGTGPLTFTAMNATSPFGVDMTLTTCTTTLAINTSCTVAVFFKPVSTGLATGTLTITDNAPGSPQTVNLTGNGVAAASTLTISPSSATCGTVAKGSPNPCSTVTLTNTSTTTVITLTSKTAAPAAEFAIAGATTCTSSLAANTSCTLAVTFTPAEADLRNGTVTIVYDPGTGTRTAVIPYSGTGT